VGPDFVFSIKLATITNLQKNRVQTVAALGGIFFVLKNKSTQTSSTWRGDPEQ